MKTGDYYLDPLVDWYYEYLKTLDCSEFLSLTFELSRESGVGEQGVGMSVRLLLFTFYFLLFTLDDSRFLWVPRWLYRHKKKKDEKRKNINKYFNINIGYGDVRPFIRLSVRLVVKDGLEVGIMTVISS